MTPNATRESELDDLACRSYALNISTLDDSTRSVEAVLATESPVMAIDFRKMQYVNEVLLMNGCRLPANNQIPLLDSHSRMTVGTIL
jgi:hypothetical protein